MAMITSIRAPLPVAELPLTPPQRDPRSGIAATAPVARTDEPHAIRQIEGKPATADPHLLEARQTVETAAATAAENARAAYIRASIAAGISPLPLPGA